MCKHYDEAMERGHNNFNALGESIKRLDIPCRYKGAFVTMADARGFRFTENTLSQMETIGKTDSDVLINLFEGKERGIIVPYILATYLDTDKNRAKVLEYLSENNQNVTEKNVLKAILSVRK